MTIIYELSIHCMPCAKKKKHTKPVSCTSLHTRQIPTTPLELSKRVFQSDRKMFTFVGYDVTRGTSGSSDIDYERACLQKCDIVQFGTDVIKFRKTLLSPNADLKINASGSSEMLHTSLPNYSASSPTRQRSSRNGLIAKCR